MKRLIVQMAIALIAISAAAQEYLPVLVDGRKWVLKTQFVYRTTDPATLAMGNPEIYTCVGDTVIDGEVYKFIDYEIEGAPSSLMKRSHGGEKIYKEVDGAAYGCYCGLYPLTMPLMWDMKFELGHPHVDDIHYMEVGGKMRKVIVKDVGRRTKLEGGKITYRIWIEGIGPINGITYTEFTNIERDIQVVNDYTFEVWDGDEKIFDRTEFFEEFMKLYPNSSGVDDNYGGELIDPTDINIIDADEQEQDNQLYNLMGQPVDHPRKGTIYVRKGKKILW